MIGTRVYVGKINQILRGDLVHEMSIAQSLLDIAQEEAKRHRLEKVSVIRLRIGALAAVVPESLSFCFDLLSKDTVASGASLSIETVPVVSRCDACDIHFEVHNHIYLCPQCGAPALELASGRELSIAAIEGETGGEDGSSEHSSGPEYTSGE